MIEGAPVLALIPARGGSKGLPRKNVLEIGGAPMIAWSVAAARAAASVDRIVVSTDDPEIADAARAAGAEVPFLRPAALADDAARTVDVIRHAVAELAHPDEGWLVLLQPTSPLRIAADIEGAIAACRAAGAELCVSVTDAPKPLAWLYHAEPDGRLVPAAPQAAALDRRQDARRLLALNGAVYVGRVARVLAEDGFLAADTAAYVMPRSRSVDIDDAVDLALARLLMKG